MDEPRISQKNKLQPELKVVARAGQFLFVGLCAWLDLAVDLNAKTPFDWQNGTGFRRAPLELSANAKTGLTKLQPAATGIAFTNFLSDESAARNQIRLNGSGVAAGDIDGDGWCDLYFCGLEGGNRLYRNLGNWKFEDITAGSGVGCEGQFSQGTLLADIDGDGTLDLLVNSVGGGTRSFLNDAKGRFTEVTTNGLVKKFAATSMAMADVDGDGDLDLYVSNNRTTTVRSTGIDVLNVGGKRMLKPEQRDDYEFTPQGALLEHGEIDILYLNDGHGNFQRVSWLDGSFRDEEGKPLMKPPRDWGLAVQFRDMNGDGAPDLYVCNDFHSPDRIWINNGKGEFRALARLSLRNTSASSMGVDFADLNRDGYDDFLVVDMLDSDRHRYAMQTAVFKSEPRIIGIFNDRPQLDRNTLQLNRGDGTFAEVAYFSGLEATSWSWCPAFLDIDLDGYEDLLITTGHQFDTQDLDAEDDIERKGPYPKGNIYKKLLLYPPLPVNKVAFRNQGNLKFKRMNSEWGFDEKGVAHGLAMADLDHDGDLDVIVNNLNTAAGIYRNDGGAPRIAVRLNGLPPNFQGIGAKIRVSGGPVPQSQEIISGGRYLSGDDPMRVFAAGSSTNLLKIEVTWRSGKQSIVTGATPNFLYEIAEASAQPARDGSHPVQESRTIFEDVSGLIQHIHVDEPYDDFQRQPLLPFRLSQSGPGISWYDVDGDGWDDLMIGSGKGGRLSIYRNTGSGTFTSDPDPSLNQTATRDMTTLFGMTISSGRSVLIVGSSNFEDASNKSPVARIYDLAKKSFDDTMPGQFSSTGPLATADVDGDGDLDLFVGGSSVPGRYPEPASSILFRNDNGQFKPDVAIDKHLDSVGLVSGAVFSDLDNDGDPDLILACQWGPIRVFRNDRGSFVEITEKLGLQRFVGWWNGVTTGDFDGDGRLDIVASNWGLNSNYRTSGEKPRSIYYGDLDGNGTFDLVEAYYDESLKKEVPERDLISIASALPFIRQHFSTFKSYGSASVAEIFGEKIKQARRLEVTELASMIFLNRGDHFEARPLPSEAQFSVAFGTAVADYDGDGIEDIFLSQNFFAMQPQTSRSDAGRGLWLKGDGRAGFVAIEGQKSGVLVYGEQRGAALGDYDGDGRVDLVISQNGAETKLYRNTGGSPGLRIRLNGPAGNPKGIGAVLQLISENGPGPARESHVGNGYWSQDSAVAVMSSRLPAKRVQVRWSWGETVVCEIPMGAKEIEVKENGKVRVIR